MPKADFVPERDGFHFANEFVNVIAKFPGYGTIETGGRCGGMAYAALDYWFNGRLPIPADAALPHDGTLMADYIYKRLLETYLVPSAINFITWTLAGDGENFFHKGVTRWTKEGEFPKLKAMIDKGKPQVLGLVKVTDLRQIGEDHQVVGYGYEDDGKGNLVAYLWDNRYPDREVRLTTNAKKRSTGRSPRETRTGAAGSSRAMGRSGRTSCWTARSCRRRARPAIHLVAGGAKFAVAERDGAGRSRPQPARGAAGGRGLTGVHRGRAGERDAAEGARAGSGLPDRRRAKKRAVAGAQAMDAHGLSKDDVRTVPEGGLQGIPDGDPVERLASRLTRSRRRPRHPRRRRSRLRRTRWSPTPPASS